MVQVKIAGEEEEIKIKIKKPPFLSLQRIFSFANSQKIQASDRIEGPLLNKRDEVLAQISVRLKKERMIRQNTNRRYFQKVLKNSRKTNSVVNETRPAKVPVTILPIRLFARNLVGGKT